MKRESKIKKTYSGSRLTIAVSIYTLRNNIQIKKKKSNSGAQDRY